ncbi:hypothetical protein [Bacillus licheniformis]|nr:hypothetical protein UF14_17460 [Bacillus licheniformis]
MKRLIMLAAPLLLLVFPSSVLAESPQQTPSNVIINPVGAGEWDLIGTEYPYITPSDYKTKTYGSGGGNIKITVSNAQNKTVSVGLYKSNGTLVGSYQVKSGSQSTKTFTWKSISKGSYYFKIGSNKSFSSTVRIYD